MGGKRTSAGAAVLAELLAISLVLGASVDAGANATLLRFPRALPASGFNVYVPDSAALSGGAVVANVTARSHATLRRLDASGGLTTVPGPRLSGFVSRTVLGSATRLATLTASNTYSSTGIGALAAGPPAGPLAELSACARAKPVLDGDALAYIDEGCAGGGPRLVVADLAAGSTTVVAALASSDRPGGLRLSGDFLGFALGGMLVVSNWRTGATVQSVAPEAPLGCDLSSALPHNAPPEPRMCAFAIDSDGSLWQLVDSVAVSDPNPAGKYSFPVLVDACHGRIDRTAPGAPGPVPVAGGACANELRVAGGRALFAAPQTSGRFKGLSDERIVAGPGGLRQDLGVPGPIFGFDGATVLAEHSTCTSQSILTLPVPGASPLAPEVLTSGDCPYTVRSARLRLGRHPRLSVVLGCAKGCVGPLLVGTPDTTGAVDGASQDFSLPPGGHRRLTIRLSRRASVVRRALGRRRSKLGFWRLGFRDDPRHASAVVSGDQPTLAAPVRVSGH